MKVKSSRLNWKSVREEKLLKAPIPWDEFKSSHPLPTVDKKDMHDKWLVVTTISEPTEDVKKLAKIEGWRLLVVGDKKTPEGWKYVSILVVHFQSFCSILHDYLTNKNECVKANFYFFRNTQIACNLLFEIRIHHFYM